MTRSPLDRLRHDLRTPLIVVVSYADMLAEDLAEGPDGDVELAAELRATFEEGHRLLAALDAVPRPVGTDQAALDRLLVDVGTALRPGVDGLIARCSTLIERAEDRGRDDLAEDERRMLISVEQLGTMIIGATGPADPDHSAGDPSAEDPSTEDPSTEDPSTEDPSSEAPSGQDRPILVVDDHEVNREVLSRHLNRQGHRTVTAPDADRGLALLRSGSYALVLLDVVMPGTPGDELLAIMKSDPELREVPVIMITAHDETDTLVRCIELGAEDYLPKPFDPILLRARISASLEKRRLRDAEIDHLQRVGRLTAAAAELEAGAFDPASVAELTEREDELGTLARVFVSMAGEVAAREQRLQSELHQLRIEFDEQRTARQVAEITETDYFRDLQHKAAMLRLRADRDR